MRGDSRGKPRKRVKAFVRAERDVCRQRRSRSLSTPFLPASFLMYETIHRDRDRDRDRDREGAQQKHRDSSASSRRSRNISTWRIANVANPRLLTTYPARVTSHDRENFLLSLSSFNQFSLEIYLRIVLVYPLLFFFFFSSVYKSIRSNEERNDEKSFDTIKLLQRRGKSRNDPTLRVLLTIVWHTFVFFFLFFSLSLSF